MNISARTTQGPLVSPPKSQEHDRGGDDHQAASHQAAGPHPRVETRHNLRRDDHPQRLRERGQSSLERRGALHFLEEEWDEKEHADETG